VVSFGGRLANYDIMSREFQEGLTRGFQSPFPIGHFTATEFMDLLAGPHPWQKWRDISVHALDTIDAA
jgi:hypothetical protein